MPRVASRAPTGKKISTKALVPRRFDRHSPVSGSQTWLTPQLTLSQRSGTHSPPTQISLPVHQLALVVNGVHLLENLKLDELAQKQVYEFAFVMQPIKLQGGTGSTVAPVAVR